MTCGVMHSRGSRRFWLTDLFPGACRHLYGLPLALLVACSLSLADNPVWAAGPDTLANHATFPLHHDLRPQVSGSGVDAACEEQIRNGGFTQIQGWNLGASPRPARVAYPPRHEAVPIVHLGIHTDEADRAVNSFSSIWQEITLPPDQVSTLRWVWQLRTEEDVAVSPGTDEDRQQILLLDAEGNLLEVIVSTRMRQRTWSTQIHDLSPYAGQTVRLYFNAYNDGDVLVTSMWLDDISVQACAVPPLGIEDQIARTGEALSRDWSHNLETSHNLAGFLLWGLGLGFSLLLVVLGLQERRQSAMD